MNMILKNERDKRGKIFVGDLEKKWKEEKETLRQKVALIIKQRILNDEGHARVLATDHLPPVKLLAE